MLTLNYTITSKVETKRLNDDMAHLFHGTLQLQDSGTDPLNLALAVPDDVWNALECGDTLNFVAQLNK